MTPPKTVSSSTMVLYSSTGEKVKEQNITIEGDFDKDEAQLALKLFGDLKTQKDYYVQIGDKKYSSADLIRKIYPSPGRLTQSPAGQMMCRGTLFGKSKEIQEAVCTGSSPSSPLVTQPSQAQAIPAAINSSQSNFKVGEKAYDRTGYPFIIRELKQVRDAQGNVKWMAKRKDGNFTVWFDVDHMSLKPPVDPEKAEKDLSKVLKSGERKITIYITSESLRSDAKSYAQTSSVGYKDADILIKVVPSNTEVPVPGSKINGRYVIVFNKK